MQDVGRFALGPLAMSMVGPETTNFPGSSHLASATYDPDVENLTIDFQDGGSYLYFNVPRWKYRGLQMASSAGKYFHDHIKGQHAYEKQ